MLFEHSFTFIVVLMIADFSAHSIDISIVGLTPDPLEPVFLIDI